MSERLRVIVNPMAGRGRVPRFVRELKRYLAAESISCDFLETRFPGHASDLARTTAAEGARQIIAMGGDGTVSETARGIAGGECALGIISVGTGNDVARSLGLPINDPVSAFRVVLQGNSRAVDLGRDADGLFVSLLGLGFPARVARLANDSRRIRGSAAFFFATYRSILSMQSVPLRIELENEVIEDRFTSILVQNTPYTGGGLLVAPQARMDDGLLDVIMVRDIGKFDLMANFPRVYLGRHLSHSKFSLRRTRWIRITSDAAVEKMFDGNLEGNMPVETEILPRAVRVFVREE